MKRALLKSHNLIGDGLYVGPVAEKWYREHGHEFDEVHLYTLKNHATSLYEGMGVPWKIVFEPEPPYDLEIDFNVSKAFQISDQKKCHLVNSYAELAGVSPEGLEPVPNYRPPEMEVPDHLRNLVMVSPHSMSCASRGNPPGPANKMLAWPKWKPSLAMLRDEYPDSPLVFLGAPEDKIPSAKDGGFDTFESDYLLGIPMPFLANIMKYAKCVITVDNGMGHLAASQRANHFYMASGSLSLHFITPWGNKNLRVFHLKPLTDEVDPVVMRWALLSAVRDWKAKE